MGLLITDSIDDLNYSFDTYSCAKCLTNILSSSWIIPGTFRGRKGEAFFTSKVANYLVSADNETRGLMTGTFDVKDVKCKQCLTEIGWKYIKTSAKDQEYKVNNFVIEKNLLVVTNTKRNSLTYYLTKLLQKNIKLSTSTSMEKVQKDFIEDLNNHSINLETVENQEEINFDFYLKNYQTLILIDKVIYHDERTYFEMKKDLLLSTSYYKDFRFVFHGEETDDLGDNFVDKNAIDDLLVVFKQSKGYVIYNKDDFKRSYANVYEEDEAISEEEEIISEDEEDEDEDDHDGDNDINYPPGYNHNRSIFASLAEGSLPREVFQRPLGSYNYQYYPQASYFNAVTTIPVSETVQNSSGLQSSLHAFPPLRTSIANQPNFSNSNSNTATSRSYVNIENNSNHNSQSSFLVARGMFMNPGDVSYEYSTNNRNFSSPRLPEEGDLE